MLPSTLALVLESGFVVPACYNGKTGIFYAN